MMPVLSPKPRPCTGAVLCSSFENSVTASPTTSTHCCSDWIARTVRMFRMASEATCAARERLSFSLSMPRTVMDAAETTRMPTTGMSTRIASESLHEPQKLKVMPETTAKSAATVVPKASPVTCVTRRAWRASVSDMLSVRFSGSSKKPISCRTMPWKASRRRRSARNSWMKPVMARVPPSPTKLPTATRQRQMVQMSVCRSIASMGWM
mmetsp:Transcript_36921/g.95297  ORF Transcript_36921/g.95297 Transcript_36921/m.95297 type:complete len:209 (+) Transcript_36921:997-1623(+)